jgi:acetylornithine deacetylase
MNQAAGQASAELLSILTQLLQFKTISRESNLELIHWVQAYLAGFGITSRLTYDSTGRKANLFATVGQGREPGIILSGHTDVVPVEGQEWHSDPFAAHVQGERLYARGAADMKGFIAAALASVPHFLAAKMDAPIHLAFSYDEEIGCIGVRSLIRDLQEIGLKPAACIVGEPTNMQIIVAHKGTHRFRCCVRGREAHSSYTTQGVNAIEYAARIIVFIRELAERMARNEERDLAYTVPYTTLQTGLVRGGLATNIVPKECDFQFEARTLPTTRAEDMYQEIRDFAATLLPEMQQVEPMAAIDFEWLASAPGLQMQNNDPLVRMVSGLLGQAPNGAVSYGTEAGLFQQAGIPTVICGPGSIEQAHRPDEYVELQQLAQCEQFLHKLINAKI